VIVSGCRPLLQNPVVSGYATSYGTYRFLIDYQRDSQPNQARPNPVGFVTRPWP